MIIFALLIEQSRNTMHWIDVVVLLCCFICISYAVNAIYSMDNNQIYILAYMNCTY